MGILDAEDPAKTQAMLSPPTMPPPIPEAPQEDFFKFRLDNSDILEEIEHQLRGEVYGQLPNGQGGYIQKFPAEMSEEGIADILGMIYSLGINKNTILGNLTHEEIYTRCREVWKEAAQWMVKKKVKYNIDQDRRSILVKKIVYSIHSGLSRSEQGRESDQISTASQRVEHFLKEDSAKKKASPMELFRGFGRSG